MTDKDVRDRATEALADIRRDHTRGSREHAERLADEVERLRRRYEPLSAPFDTFVPSNEAWSRGTVAVLEENAGRTARKKFQDNESERFEFAQVPELHEYVVELEARNAFLRKVLNRAGWELREHLAAEAVASESGSPFSWTPDDVRRIQEELETERLQRARLQEELERLSRLPK